MRRAQRGITDAGFQFLLSDSHRQLWAFLSFYINDVAKSSTSSGETGPRAVRPSSLHTAGCPGTA